MIEETIKAYLNQRLLDGHIEQLYPYVVWSKYDRNPTQMASEITASLNNSPEHIIAAAFIGGGVTFSIPKPARHSDLFSAMSVLIPPEHQGFLTSEGRFVDRTEAYQIAATNGQLAGRAAGQYDGNELFSEDLW